MTSIHPHTAMGPVHLTVANLEKVAAFYQEILGFSLLSNEGGTAALGAGSRELLRLTEQPGARRMRTAGLYHTAFLVPTRWELAHLLRRIVDTRTPIQGTSNHGTHLAIYLPDPEGNGIELAWDFPKEEWPMRNGMYDIASVPRQGVDVEALFSELENDPSPWNGLSPDTLVGHVHLHVADLDASARFYHELLGFGVTMQSSEFGALFVSAGGYHHHIGMNIWRGPGLPPPADDAAGLRSYQVDLPNETELQRIAALLDQGGVEREAASDKIVCRDPSGIRVVFAVGTE